MITDDRSNEFSVGASTKLFIKIGRDGLTDPSTLYVEYTIGEMSLLSPSQSPSNLQGAYVVFIPSSSILNRGLTS